MLRAGVPLMEGVASVLVGDRKSFSVPLFAGVPGSPSISSTEISSSSRVLTTEVSPSSGLEEAQPIEVASRGSLERYQEVCRDLYCDHKKYYSG